MRYLILCLFVLTNPGYAKDHKKVASSGPNVVHLVELYSSESCSSCPPADKWISEFKERQDLWKSFVPIVFHVDYWNDLGWKDGLSSNLMTRRQQDVARTWAEPSVYTPAVVIDGQEWRQWSRNVLPQNRKKSRVQMTIYQESANEFQVAVEGLEKGDFMVRIAILGMDLNSNVTSGENGGRRLVHNFAVLDWDSKLANQKSSTLLFTLHGKNTPKTAIVAWIEKGGRPVPLQATGGYL